jgi:hypothetical protein
MAVTVTFTTPAPGDWVVDIVESSTSNGETRTLTPDSSQRFPRAGRIMRLSSGFTSGTGTTLQPIISSSSTDFETGVVLMETSAEAAPDEQPEDGVRYGFTGNSLYFRSNPDAGSDNSIVTRILIKAGWV